MNTTEPQIAYSECYAQPFSRLYFGDCIEIMSQIESKSIDMILCDLPYGTTANSWDVIIPFELLWEQYERIIKDNGTIALFGSEPFSSLLRVSNMKLYKYDWIWYKNLPTNFLNARKQPLRTYETISIFCKGVNDYYPLLEIKPKSNIRRNPHIFNQTNNGTYGKINEGYNRFENREIPDDKNYPCNVIELDIEHRTKRIHPTQKPVSIMEYLIKTYTKENETILDNTMGSGTTGIACHKQKRNFVGIEKDEQYFNMAKKRIETHNVQSELF